MTINDLLYTDTSLFLWSENVLAWPFRGPLYSHAGIESEKLQSSRKFVAQFHSALASKIAQKLYNVKSMVAHLC